MSSIPTTDNDGRPIDANATALNLAKVATDAHLELIGRVCKKLEKLDISGSKDCSDTGLMKLAGLKTLKTLEFLGCPNATKCGYDEFRFAQKAAARGA